MENNKRIMLSLALVAIVAVAAVGVGFAYTAMTTNSGNTASSEYITLVQGDTGAYTFAPTGDSQHVYWDANDYKQAGQVKTDFTLTGVVDKSITGYDLVKLGNSFSLKADSVGAATAPAISIDIGAQKFIMPTDGLVIIMKAVDDHATPLDSSDDSTEYFKLTANNTFTKITILPGTMGTSHSLSVTKSGNDYATITVTMYYGYLSSLGKIVVPHEAGVQPEGPPTNPIDDATLTFTINVVGANDPGATALQRISVDKVALELTVGGGNGTATITFDPAEATNKAVTVTSSDTDVATVSADNGTVTVTPVAVGNAVITITSAEGSYTAQIAVIVQAGS